MGNKTRVFTETEKQAIKNDYENTSLKDLSRKFSANSSSIRAVLTEMGVSLRGRGRPRLTLPRAGEVRIVEDDDDNLFDDVLTDEDEDGVDKDFDSWN